MNQGPRCKRCVFATAMRSTIWSRVYDYVMFILCIKLNRVKHINNSCEYYKEMKNE